VRSYDNVPGDVGVQRQDGLADLHHEGRIALKQVDLRAGDEAKDGQGVAAAGDRPPQSTNLASPS
jgi:hypothetical protein